MKLTKRLLAIVLAAAMLVGMVVISTSAIQLDESVDNLTWDDCADINPETNPYTVKMGFKIYKVNTSTGEYTLLADTNAANDTLDVNVEAGDVLRVETWAQTNFHTIGIQLTPAYNNEWLLPTKMDYSVVTSTASYPLKAANVAGKTAMDDYPKMVDFCADYGTGDGTFENPVFVTEALTQAKGQINHNSWSGLRGVLPKDWQGKGTAEGTWINTAAVDQWGNSIVDENGHLIYNVYQMGMGNNASGSEAWTGFGVVLNVYQPIAVFNLTVAEDAKGTAKLFYPLSSYYNTTNAYTQFTAMSYEAVQDSPNVNGNWDESMPQVCASGLTTYANKVTYGDGTVADKNWIVTNATITVGDAAGGEDDTTTEPPTTEPPVEYADLAALQAAIAAAATADTANCTSASVAEFNAALAAAQALNVEGTLATEQDAINAAAARLNAAITGLTKLGTCNYTALDAAIAAAATADTTNCTSASVAEFNAALAAAQAVTRDMIADEAGENQAIIDAAAARLNAAITGLTKLGACDYTALDAAIAQAKALDENDYTSTSWYSQAYLTSYLDAAEAVARDMVADEAGENQAIIDNAKDALLAAIAMLELRADFTALKAAIATAATADTANCTAASVAEFDAALAAAQELADSESSIGESRQAEVDAAAARLNAAITGLTKLGGCDYTALDAAITAYDALDKNAYTPNSWTASDVDALAAAAKAVARDLIADEAGANQATINAAADALDAAIKALVKVADKAALAAAIAAAPTDADAYTPDSWAAADLANVLAAANAVNADANATQADVDAQVAAIAAAVAKLALKADKAALAEAIAAAKTLDANDYTPDSWAAANLEAVIAAAEAVNADGNASDADVTAAIQSLRDAALLLEEKADTEALEEAIDTLPAIAEDDADPESWAAYEAALAAAELVFADPNATQAEVDKAEADLLAAISAVKEKDVVYCDYSALDEAIAAFEALVEAEYTPASYATVKAYYDAAKAVTRDMEYTVEAQDEIDFAADELNNSIALDLVKVADKTALKAAIDTVVDTANCTSASIAKYNAALADANAVYADANATQQAVDAATEALVAAQQLEKLPKVDYSDLEDAMAKFEALDATEWTDDSYAAAQKAYDAAAELVEADLYDDEQGENAGLVDEATDALNAAIAALEKAVDKTALKAEIDKAPSVEENLATDETWADYADALANAQDVYADDAATQNEVDAAAAELAAANAALATRGLVDYTALDAALALVPALGQDEYTAKSWKAYADAKAAAEAIARDLIDDKAGANQKTVDDAAAALDAAYKALTENKANITDVKYDNTGVYTTGTLKYDFYVNGAASKIQILAPDGGTMTFDRRSSRVTIVSYNEAGEVVDYAEEDPAYEVWSINLGLVATEYQVRAKYDYTWDTEYYAFTVEYAPYNTTAESFTATVGEYVDATEVVAAKGEVITFKAVTDSNAIKVQFVFADGGTSTYTRTKAVDNGDGTLTWTITRVFKQNVDINLRVKAPTGWATEYSGNVVVTMA
ncbi:MAG: FIVAR domain-containing protein [Clostridia bacterium]|nr:FIVAR domain-containing protein [Clostridia bacterium]